MATRRSWVVGTESEGDSQAGQNTRTETAFTRVTAGRDRRSPPDVLSRATGAPRDPARAAPSTLLTHRIATFPSNAHAVPAPGNAKSNRHRAAPEPPEEARRTL